MAVVVAERLAFSLPLPASPAIAPVPRRQLLSPRRCSRQLFWRYPKYRAAAPSLRNRRFQGAASGWSWARPVAGLGDRWGSSFYTALGLPGTMRHRNLDGIPGLSGSPERQLEKGGEHGETGKMGNKTGLAYAAPRRAFEANSERLALQKALVLSGLLLPDRATPYCHSRRILRNYFVRVTTGNMIGFRGPKKFFF